MCRLTFFPFFLVSVSDRERERESWNIYPFCLPYIYIYYRFSSTQGRYIYIDMGQQIGKTVILQNAKPFLNRTSSFFK